MALFQYNFHMKIFYWVFIVSTSAIMIYNKFCSLFWYLWSFWRFSMWKLFCYSSLQLIFCMGILFRLYPYEEWSDHFKVVSWFPLMSSEFWGIAFLLQWLTMSPQFKKINIYLGVPKLISAYVWYLYSWSCLNLFWYRFF